MTVWTRRPAALLLGGGFALGQPPFELWFVACAALVAVVALFARTRTARDAAWTGWAFGAGYFALSMFWLLEPFQVDAATTGWIAPFALAGMAGGLALFWAAAFSAAHVLGGSVALVFCWSAAELARSYLLTGFPWGHLGHVWAQTPVVQWHAVFGADGLAFVTVALAAATVFAWRRARLGLLAVAAALGVLWFGGAWLAPPPQDLSGRPLVRIVQPNAAQHLKWDPAYSPTFFNRQVGYTARLPRPDLVVWPETAIATYLHNAGPALELVSEAAAGAPVLMGLLRADEGGYYNSAVLLGSDAGVRQIYDKHHLVPFGEYMPFADLFSRFNILGLANRADNAFSPGPGPRLMDFGPLGQALPLICYEAVFAREVNAAPDRPDFLVQLTNDAWFGTWAGPQQHLQQARLRAIEQRLPLIRAANTGISAMIDPAGRILHRLTLGEAGYIDAALPAPGARPLYARLGDAPVFVLLLTGIVALTARRVGKRRSGH